MLKKDAIEHFKTQDNIADALKISAAAVSRWGEVVPLLRAYQLQGITRGALKMNEELYRDRIRLSEAQ